MIDTHTFHVRNNSGRIVTATLCLDGERSVSTIAIDGMLVATVSFVGPTGSTKRRKILHGAARALRQALEHASRNRANRAARRAAEEAALAATDAMADVAEVQP